MTLHLTDKFWFQRRKSTIVSIGVYRSPAGLRYLAQVDVEDIYHDPELEWPETLCEAAAAEYQDMESPESQQARYEFSGLLAWVKESLAATKLGSCLCRVGKRNAHNYGGTVVYSYYRVDCPICKGDYEVQWVDDSGPT